VANVATLRGRGVHVLDPDVGRLTGADSGPGRMPEPVAIAAAALALVGPQDLTGRTVVVSAGGTREPIDPVRFLGNRSTGRQGVALAVAARRRGARVVLVAANLAVPVPPGVSVVAVETAARLREAVRSAAGEADAVVMAAAVADFRPVAPSSHKIKKSDGAPAPIALTATVDVLAELAADRVRPGQVVVGFAAETGDATGGVLDHGRAKALRKGADLLVVNAVGPDRGFGTEDNEVTILDAAGAVVAKSAGTKDHVADAVWDAVVPLLGVR
jgi:phosphopantothenoylcysteine decarboxylase/phosphopantothenate--cysteine ligase